MAMKKTIIILSVGCALMALAASCAKETLAVPEGISFTGTFSPVDSRTTVADDGEVSWLLTDEIGVYDGTSYVKATTTSVNGMQINFTAPVSDSAPYYIAVYPYEAGASLSSGLTDDKVAVSPVFSAQTKSACHVAVARIASKADPFSFKNVTNLIRFTTARADIASLRFTANGGENVVGDMLVDPATGVCSSLLDSGKSSTFTSTIGSAGTWYLALAQNVNMASGFTVELYDSSSSLLGTVTTSKPLSVTRNQIRNLGDIDDDIHNKAWFSYIRWKVYAINNVATSDPAQITPGNNMGLDKNVYPNMFRKPLGEKYRLSVAESDIPAGATVSYAWNNGTSMVAKWGDINATNGNIDMYAQTAAARAMVHGAWITVTVTKDGDVYSKNVPIFSSWVAPGASGYSVDYVPFVLLCNGRKDNSLPAPTILDSDSNPVTMSLSIRKDLYYFNIDGPIEHKMSGKLQAANSSEYLGRVFDMYYAKIGKTPNYGVAWPFSTYSLSDKTKPMADHWAASPLYIATDNTVHVKAETASDSFWKDDYGYPNGFFSGTCSIASGSGVDAYTNGLTTGYPIPFIVYFNENLEY